MSPRRHELDGPELSGDRMCQAENTRARPLRREQTWCVSKKEERPEGPRDSEQGGGRRPER